MHLKLPILTLVIKFDLLIIILTKNSDFDPPKLEIYLLKSFNSGGHNSRDTQQADKKDDQHIGCLGEEEIKL